jgi:hypothetical protein
MLPPEGKTNFQVPPSFTHWAMTLRQTPLFFTHGWRTFFHAPPFLTL